MMSLSSPMAVRVIEVMFMTSSEAGMMESTFSLASALVCTRLAFIPCSLRADIALSMESRFARVSHAMMPPLHWQYRKLILQERVHIGRDLGGELYGEARLDGRTARRPDMLVGLGDDAQGGFHADEDDGATRNRAPGHVRRDDVARAAGPVLGHLQRRRAG